MVLVVDDFGGKGRFSWLSLGGTFVWVRYSLLSRLPGNVLNFNVGDGVKFALPNVFWTRLSGKYGTLFFVKENGIDLAVTNAVEAIVECLRSEDGFCTAPPETGVSLKSLGM